MNIALYIYHIAHANGMERTALVYLIVTVIEIFFCAPLGTSVGDLDGDLDGTVDGKKFGLSLVS